MDEDIKYTKYEKARILGARALQISMGAPSLIKLSEKDLEEIGYNPVEIAKRELKADVIPITVKRPYPLSEEYVKGKKAEEKSAS